MHTYTYVHIFSYIKLIKYTTYFPKNYKWNLCHLNYVLVLG